LLANFQKKEHVPFELLKILKAEEVPAREIALRKTKQRSCSTNFFKTLKAEEVQALENVK
jgi:hypothetical protein